MGGSDKSILCGLLRQIFRLPNQRGCMLHKKGNGTSSMQWESQGKEHYNFERIGEWSGDDRKTMYKLLYGVKYSVYRISGAACFIKKEMELIIYKINTRLCVTNTHSLLFLSLLGPRVCSRKACRLFWGTSAGRHWALGIP